MKSLVMSVFLVILFIFSLGYVDTAACNPKGSIAAQIKWAGHKACE